jgi:hypothetical protein
VLATIAKVASNKFLIFIFIVSYYNILLHELFGLKDENRVDYNLVH